MITKFKIFENKKFYDINYNIVKDGDVIDIHQTVNGENLFYIKSLNPLDIRYFNNIDSEYEYNKTELLSPSNIIGEPDIEIIDNISWEELLKRKEMDKFNI